MDSPSFPKLTQHLSNRNKTRMTIHYYYTSVETLFNIVQSRTWRFTNVRFMNDGNEFHFGWKLMQRLEPKLEQIRVDEMVSE